jgi:hypothetical protein
LDIQADSGEINYLNANDNAYALDIDYDDEEAKEAYAGDSKGEYKQASLVTKKMLQRKHLLHAVWNFPTTKPILTPSKVILTTSFGCPFQETITQGIHFGSTSKT